METSVLKVAVLKTGEHSHNGKGNNGNNGEIELSRSPFA